MASIRRASPILVLLTAAFLATLPLVLYGPSCGHDLTFHLLNWMDAAHQWQHGTLRPWWCFPAAWSTGEPRFLFYPPLSWNLGALLTLLLGAAHAPIAYTFVALTASGITMRRFLVDYVPQPLSLLGSCLYLANPYMLFTATERTAYSELLAAAWLPWFMQESLRDRMKPLHLAIPVALLWLTNTPAAVLGTYTLALVIGIRVVLHRKHRWPTIHPLLIPTLTGYLFGLALADFYLLPAVVQHTAVEVTQAFTEGMRPEDGTLFHHTGQPLHDHVVHQASWLAVLLLSIAALAAVIHFLRQTRVAHAWLTLRKKNSIVTGNLLSSGVKQETSLPDNQNTKNQQRYPVLLTLTAATAFLLTPASLFFWHHAPELQFLQFPWRILMLQGVVTVTLTVLAVRVRLKMRWTIPLALVTVTAISFVSHHTFAQVCDSEDAPDSVAAQFVRGGGFEPYDEYTPKDADNDLLHPSEPSGWTAASATAFAVPAVNSLASERSMIAKQTYAGGQTYQVQPARGDRFAILRQRRFRNWHVSLDGIPVATEPLRDDDLIAIPLPDSAHHTITLAYRWSVDQIAGVAVSLIAAITGMVLQLCSRTHNVRLQKK